MLHAARQPRPAIVFKLECNDKEDYERALALFGIAERQFNEAEEDKKDREISLKGKFFTVKNALKKIKEDIKSTKNKIIQRSRGGNS